ncbi:META domain-containing protein [Rhodobacter ferrooxidans]|uniref:DUF306 domain-containing protein n=1 Tax=Rhodobacter ferrooxidans TaxID=371731 RepID=C8S0X5_9RHOB|nr:META domain-containing protein [Rhodobacter sp. SW2]EEW25416.1 protein of unknown function DUF306 Meta and HslJ [Rhodobacter sp. SW2]
MKTVAGLLLALAMAGGAARAQDLPADALATIWQLQSLDGAAFAATATVELATPGQLAGQAPCNRYGAELLAPLPAFRPGPIWATRMACADLRLEADFLAALAAMTQAELSEGPVLRLTGPDGRHMEFAPKAD